jgi:branched-chain amino acid transport system substrate-binding protein
MNKKQITRRQILGAAPASLLLGSRLAHAGDWRNSSRGNTVIGALLSLTGEWSTLGLASQALLQIAIEEINDLFSDLGQPRRFKLLIEDTQLKPELALQKAVALVSNGARYIVGPQSSAEAAALRSYANSIGLIVISQGSTAGSLSLPGDSLFRFVPDDAQEAAALVALLRARGVNVIVPVGRLDVGNEGLQTATKRLFEATGGLVMPGTRYTPDTKDFSAVLQSLSAQVAQAASTQGNGAVGVYLTAFDEVTDLFMQAQSWGELVAVKWYGSDGVALSNALLANTQAARFAARVDYPNPTLGLSAAAGPKWMALTEKVKQQLGSEPDAFALAAYDACWVSALLHTLKDESNRAIFLNQVLPRVAEFYCGATGWTALNEAGDRRYGDYDFWAIREVNGVYAWKKVVKYQSNPGQPGSVIELEV